MEMKEANTGWRTVMVEAGIDQSGRKECRWREQWRDGEKREM